MGRHALNHTFHVKSAEENRKKINIVWSCYKFHFCCDKHLIHDILLSRQRRVLSRQMRLVVAPANGSVRDSVWNGAGAEEKSLFFEEPGYLTVSRRFAFASACKTPSENICLV